MLLKQFSLILLFLLFFNSAQAAERVALVIGNQQYQNLKTLKNPRMDATAIAQRLKVLGFTIIRPIRRKSDVQNDLSESELLTARNAFLRAATGSKIAFLYYSGHGASLGNRLEAHILPVDIPRPNQTAASLQLLQRHALSLDTLLAGLDKKAKLTIAVFDACREIPELEKTKGIFGNQWKGLSRVKQGRSRIIAYSGSQGQFVADGNGRYSPYTQRLLEVLKNNPSQEIGNLFRDVAARVESYTNQTAEVLIQGVPPNLYYLKDRMVSNNKTNKPAIIVKPHILPKVAGTKIRQQRLKQPQTKVRKALLIVNLAYKVALRNPSNDVRSMSQKLRGLGFTNITTKINLTRPQMRDAVRQFAQGLKAGDEALFYYSGCGIQVGNISYLIPVDANIITVDELADEAMSLRFVSNSIRPTHAKLKLNLRDSQSCTGGSSVFK